MRKSIILVHGTFARRSIWPYKSLLREMLDKDFSSYTIDTVTWSGGNSMSARAKGTAALCEKITSYPPDVEHYIISHSHGGNIALYAMKNSNVRSRVAGIVCLSTPFLVAQKRNPGGSVVLSLMLGFWLPLFVLSAWRARYWDYRLEWWLFEALVFAAVFWVMTQLRVYARQACKDLSFPIRGGINLLILRKPGDEATGALAVVQFFGAIAWFFWVKSTSAVECLGKNVSSRLENFNEKHRQMLRTLWMLAVIGLLSVIMFVAFGRSELAAKVAGFLALHLTVVLIGSTAYLWLWGATALTRVVSTALMVILAPFAILPSICLLFFSPRLSFASPFLDLSAEVTPPGKWEVNALPPRPVPKKPSDIGTFENHCSLYNDQRAIEKIAAWLKSDEIGRELLQSKGNQPKELKSRMNDSIYIYETSRE